MRRRRRRPARHPPRRPDPRPLPPQATGRPGTATAAVPAGAHPGPGAAHPVPGAAHPVPGAAHPVPAPPAASGQPTPPGAPDKPAEPPTPPDPRKDLAERIKFEKELRQSSNQNLLLISVQYMAGRCDQEDVLAGNDDPNLPLVTCSQDHKFVYILDKSIISGDQIENASSGFDQQNAAYVVDLEFKEEAAKTWGDFTAANIGTQTAFTLDSRVVSAPQIREAIPAGAPRSPAVIRRSPRTRPNSWPTCSGTARCRCPSSPRRPKRSRPHWG